MNAVDHNNVVIFDDRGIPSIMCRFVRPKDAEEVPAVFKIGDKVADAIYISKYPNTVITAEPTVCQWQTQLQISHLTKRYRLADARG